MLHAYWMMSVIPSCTLNIYLHIYIHTVYVCTCLASCLNLQSISASDSHQCCIVFSSSRPVSSSQLKRRWDWRQLASSTWITVCCTRLICSTQSPNLWLISCRKTQREQTMTSVSYRIMFGGISPLTAVSPLTFSLSYMKNILNII